MKIVCIGDSLTYGYPYDESVSWVAGIEKRLAVKSVNAGVSGDTTEDMLMRFRQDVIENNPDYVIIMGGTNDAFIGIPFEKLKDNIQKMIEMSLENNIIPILGLMPPVWDTSEKYLQDIREFLINTSQTRGLKIIDFYNIFIIDAETINMDCFCDDCHPNLIGYYKMTEAVIRFLQEEIM